MTSGRYRTPDAARRAVTDRLRHHARPHGPWSLADLQRQYAYDQLIERLYRIDGGWVIKGATALLARRVAVRHTIDVDVHRAGTIRDIDHDLRRAVALDIGDWMRFELGGATPIRAAEADAIRFRVRASIGVTTWAAFHVDAVAEDARMTASPDLVQPLTNLELLDRPRVSWRAYPLVDHVADKVCAIHEDHDGRPSTRFKDLIDLVAIADSSSLDAALQLDALHARTRRRHLTLPSTVTVPDRAMWETGYRAEARRAVGLTAITLDHALAVVAPFLDPVLDGTAHGTWDPLSARWA